MVRASLVAPRSAVWFGTHPTEFTSAGGLPALVPKADVALAVGVVVGIDAVEREFSEGLRGLE